MRFLIVEDGEDYVENLLWQLKTLGFEDVEVCSYGSEEGNQRMPSLRYIGDRVKEADIILLDHELSADYDGEDVFHQCCHGKIVISTSGSSASYRYATRHIDTKRLYRKRPEVLGQAISEALAKP